MSADIVPGAAFVLLPQVVGLIVSSQVRSVMGYYTVLKKPFWSPPRFLFRPVWTVLYGLMGVASYLVFKRGQVTGTDVRPALVLYLVHLFLNAIWPTVFFRFQARFASLIIITGAVATLIATIVLFDRVDERASQLLLPVLVWSLISGYLNKAVWRYNQGRDYIDINAKKKKSKKSKPISDDEEVSESEEEEEEEEEEDDDEEEVESESEEEKVKKKEKKDKKDKSEKMVLKQVKKSKVKSKTVFKCSNCGCILE